MARSNAERIRFAALFCCFAALLLAGCSPAPQHRPTGGRLPVFAGIPPLAYLVERIGGDHVEVGILVSPGQDPHTFEPTPRQILALSRAAMFFKIDMPFENTILEKVRKDNRRLEVVDATQNIKKRAVNAACCRQTTGHDHDHEAEAGEPDPHVWLSPVMLKIMSQNIAAALCRADPAHAGDYRRNLAAIVHRLDELDRRIRKSLAPYRGRTFYVFHPGFGYLADAYGLKEEAIEAGGRAPTPKQLRSLIARAKADGVKTVFIQPQYAPESAQAVADALDAKIVAIDGLARNVLADIDDIAAKIETALRESKPPKQETRRPGP